MDTTSSKEDSDDYLRSSQMYDPSNPQQGTSAVKVKGGTSSRSSSKSPSSSENINNNKNRKLFVGGLPQDITEAEFRFFFSQFGEIVESVVMYNRETGRGRGFGFVTFVDPEVSAFLLNTGSNGDGIGRQVIRGKTCEIKAATPKGQAPSSRRSNKSTRGGGPPQPPNQVYQMPPPPPVGHQMAPFVPTCMTYPVLYPQGRYPTVPPPSFGPGYASLTFFPVMPGPVVSPAENHHLINGGVGVGNEAHISYTPSNYPQYSFIPPPTPGTVHPVPYTSKEELSAAGNAAAAAAHFVAHPSFKQESQW